jgi:hypothetical protein
MPPEISAGRKSATSLPSPTLASMLTAISRAFSRGDVFGVQPHERYILPDRKRVEESTVLENHADFSHQHRSFAR